MPTFEPLASAKLKDFLKCFCCDLFEYQHKFYSQLDTVDTLVVLSRQLVLIAQTIRLPSYIYRKPPCLFAWAFVLLLQDLFHRKSTSQKPPCLNKARHIIFLDIVNH